MAGQTYGMSNFHAKLDEALGIQDGEVVIEGWKSWGLAFKGPKGSFSAVANAPELLQKIFHKMDGDEQGEVMDLYRSATGVGKSSDRKLAEAMLKVLDRLLGSNDELVVTLKRMVAA